MDVINLKNKKNRNLRTLTSLLKITISNILHICLIINEANSNTYWFDCNNY